MKRKLSLVMLMTLSAASAQVMALGLGEAQVNSTLNAPLRATIPLTDARGIEAQQLKVRLADERAFQRAGLERRLVAGSIDLAVQPGRSGLVLALSSEGAIREPFLDLLLELNWPGGTQLRRVTLLLDPPGYAQLPVLLEGSGGASPAAAPRPAPEPAEAAPPRQAPRRESSPTAAIVADDRAYVRPGDTLWSVTSRLRPDGSISMDQMMLALVETNPPVFPSGNVNEMRAGMTLMVPPRETILTRTPEQAERQVKAQHQAWEMRHRDGGAAVAATAARPPAPARDAAPSVAAEASPDEASPSRSVADAGEGLAAPGQEGEGPRLTLLSDRELAEQQAAEGAAEIVEQAVEGAVADADREQGLASEDIAQVEAPSKEPEAEAAVAQPQQDAEGVASREAEASDEPAAEADADRDLAVAEPTPGGEEGSEEGVTEGAAGGEGERLELLETELLTSRQALETASQERLALQGELGELRDEVENLRDKLASLTAGGAGADGAGAGGVVPPDAAGVQQARPWWGALWQGARDNALTLGGVAAALSLALWAIRRRRREAEDRNPTYSDASATVMAASAMPRDARATAPEASSREAMPQAEAISEVDIFIAYGRFEEARALLEAGLKEEPERDELRLKLLRVCAELDDGKAMRQVAARLAERDDAALNAEVDRLIATYGTEPNRSGDAPVDGEGASFEPSRDAAAGTAEPVGTHSSSATFAESEAPGRSRMASYDSVAASDEPEATARSGFAPYDSVAAFEEPEVTARPGFASYDSTAASDEPEAHERPGFASYESVVASDEPEAPEPDSAPSRHSPAASERPEAPPVKETRRAPLEMIDYQPPRLEPQTERSEPEAAPPDSVFPSAAATPPTRDPQGEPASSSDDEAGSEWEIEEVAFEPMHLDNEGTAAFSTAPRALVGQAQVLLDKGDSFKARERLDQAIQHGDDAVREQAERLIAQHDL